MAYEARLAHPDKKVFVTNEIIHNPEVNSVSWEITVKRQTGWGAAGGWLTGAEAESLWNVRSRQGTTKACRSMVEWVGQGEGREAQHWHWNARF